MLISQISWKTKGFLVGSFDLWHAPINTIGFLQDQPWPKAVKSLKQTLRLDVQGAFGRNHVGGPFLKKFLLLGVECQFPWVVEEGLGIQRVIARDNQKDGCKGVNETETSTSLVGEDDAEEKLFGCQVGVLQNC